MKNKNLKIFITGKNGMVGSACWRTFKAKGYSNLIGLSSKELDLKDQNKVLDFIGKERPDIIINAAARVGGILANRDEPYDFISENLLIQTNLIHAASVFNIEKFIFLGSSCIYPKHCEQPIKEEYLLSGRLEETNQWYAIAKIAGLKMVEALNIQTKTNNHVSLMPTNLYGPGDNFEINRSHVIPALIRKFHSAKIQNSKYVEVWGDGSALREFLHVNDLAQAVVVAVENNLSENIYNIGTGKDITISGLVKLIQEITEFEGEIHWDTSKPNGTPRKVLDISKISGFWSPKIDLEDGLRNTYEWFKKNYQDARL